MQLKEAINLSIKDFKATLFIEKIDLKQTNEKYNIEKIELDLSDINN